MKAYPLVGKALWLAFSIRPSLTLKVPYQDALTVGQGYSNRLIHKAVMTSSTDAATNTEKRSEGPGNQNSTGNFNFTEPGPVMPGVDVDGYFTPTTLEELAKIIEEAQEDEADKEKRDGAKNMISDKKTTMEGCQAEIHSHIEFVSDYTSYLKALGVNAATSISGYGQEASVSGSYLDESAFSSNSLTFIASISINKQRRVSNEQFTFNTKLYEDSDRPFATRFGNRWIRGFEMGGKLMARIMLTFDEASDKEEIKAAAEASLSFWGVSGQLSTEVKSNMEKLSKKAQVKVKIFYQGDIGRQLQGRSDSMDEKNSAQQIFSTAKTWADTFLEMACAQDYSYQTLLDTYPNIGNFPENQSIAHYTTAGAVAYQLLGEMVKHTELRKTLQLREALSQAEDREIQQHEIKLIDAQKTWIRETALSPDNAIETVRHLFWLSDQYYQKWKPYLTKQSSPVEIKAFNRLVSEKDPDTKDPTTYDCSGWYEWYGKGEWTWSKLRFCLPTHTNVFSLSVFRERSQYLWGSAWYYEKVHYPADVTVRVTLKRIDSKPRVWTLTSGMTRRLSFNAVSEERLMPGRYKVQVNFYQDGPYWDDSPIGEVAEFEFTAS
ncbi:hypothetical protein X797_010371 [Metarhizium robertsii]|uniref:Subtilisin-like protease n=2 Tax=Metarhizium robertsii TaxID=568076 RepID=A0A0A1UNX6_9HYPO|nr:hypothetical protein X797_010371 [Metarhizium robertsii]